MLRADRPAGRVAGSPADAVADGAGRGDCDRARAARRADCQPLAGLECVGLLRHARQSLGAGVPAVRGGVAGAQLGGGQARKPDAQMGGRRPVSAGAKIEEVMPMHWVFE